VDIIIQGVYGQIDVRYDQVYVRRGYYYTGRVYVCSGRIGILWLHGRYNILGVYVLFRARIGILWLFRASTRMVIHGRVYGYSGRARAWACVMIILIL
jgi:hypothetical protein